MTHEYFLQKGQPALLSWGRESSRILLLDLRLGCLLLIASLPMYTTMKNANCRTIKRELRNIQTIKGAIVRASSVRCHYEYGCRYVFSGSISRRILLELPAPSIWHPTFRRLSLSLSSGVVCQSFYSPWKLQSLVVCRLIYITYTQYECISWEHEKHGHYFGPKI